MRRTLIRPTVAAIAAIGMLAAMTMLTGCSDNTQAYCDSIKTADKDKSFANKDFKDAKVVEQAVSKATEIADLAPDDLKPAWAAVTDGIKGSQEAFAAAGSTDPKKVDVVKIQAAVKKMRVMQEAAETIQKDVKERCKYDISMS